MSDKMPIRLALILSLALLSLLCHAEAPVVPAAKAPASAAVYTSGSEAPADTANPKTDERNEGSDSTHRISEDLRVREVGDGIMITTHSFPWAANSLIVEMENSDLVLVDTPYTPQATRDVLEWAAARFGKRAITAINTGYHCDNLGGSAYLLDQGIPVYGSTMTAQLLRERGDAMRDSILNWLQAPRHQRYREAHLSLPYVPPTHLFDIAEGMELVFGNETVLVYYPGPSHAPDNVVVYFPSRKLLFGGCMILGWDGVGNTTDAHLDAWPQSIRNLRRFECDLIVPGHGERHDPSLLEHTIEMLARHHE